jgi:hypothetical protein
MLQVPEGQERQDDSDSGTSPAGDCGPFAAPLSSSRQDPSADSRRPWQRGPDPESRVGYSKKPEPSESQWRPRKATAPVEIEEVDACALADQQNTATGDTISNLGRGGQAVRLPQNRTPVRELRAAEPDPLEERRARPRAPARDARAGPARDTWAGYGLWGPRPPVTETDTGQGGETETDTGPVYTDLDVGVFPDDDAAADLEPEADGVQGGSPKCVLLSGPENAAEYYGWPAAEQSLRNRFRFPLWNRRAQESKARPS